MKKSKCPRCKGSGKIKEEHYWNKSDDGPHIWITTSKCPDCNKSTLTNRRRSANK